MKLLYSSIILAFIIFQVSAFADLPARIMSNSELVGQWIGFEDGFPFFLRLSLKQDGRGGFVITFPHSDPVGKPEIYKVEHWGVKGRELLVQLSPPVQGYDAINFKVTSFNSYNMQITLTGPTNTTWKFTASLNNEKEFNNNAADSSKYLP